jgi:iron(III) transport system permease protein
LPVAVGFVFPAAYLAEQTVTRIRIAGASSALIAEVFNTVALSGIATILAVAGAMIFVYASRLQQGSLAPFLLRASSLGYALPGTVLAIGMLPVVTNIEAVVDTVAMRLLSVSTGLFLLGSGAAIVYAYTIRFLTVATGSIEAGFSRVSPSLDASARTLGQTAGGTLWHIHLPLTRPAIIAGALLVFVDCMKELPVTLLLRPLGFETLSTHLYGEAARGTYEDAAIAALLIVAVGLLPVLMLIRLRTGIEPGRPLNWFWR